MSYFEKYLKYKNKYSTLKNKNLIMKGGGYNRGDPYLESMTSEQETQKYIDEFNKKLTEVKEINNKFNNKFNLDNINNYMNEFSTFVNLWLLIPELLLSNTQLLT